jgi:hypothetical protein
VKVTNPIFINLIVILLQISVSTVYNFIALLLMISEKHFASFMYALLSTS